MWADENRSRRAKRQETEEATVKGPLKEPEEQGQVRAGLALTLPAYLQLSQVPGPGEWAGAAAPILRQEQLFLESKGRG